MNNCFIKLTNGSRILPSSASFKLCGQNSSILEVFLYKEIYFKIFFKSALTKFYCESGIEAGSGNKQEYQYKV